MGYINVQALHFRLSSFQVKAQGSIAGFLFFLPFCHARKILTDHFAVTARVDFGISSILD